MSKLKMRIAAVSMLSASMLIAPAAAVQAEELVSSYSVTTAKYDDYSSTFTLDFEKPIRKNAAKKEVEEATSSMPAATAQSGTA